MTLEDSASLTGRQIGTYRVEARLGAGGIGEGRTSRGTYDLVIVDVRLMGHK